jgi:hypothetical protein
MKIGLLTHHHIANEGAVLQAYAQIKKLEQQFPDAVVETVDIRMANYAHMKKSRGKTFIKFTRHYLQLSEECLITTDYDECINFLKRQNYDMLVVGADEVWKLEWGKYSKAFPNVYWLSQDLPGIKIALSASANLLSYRNRTSEQLRRMGDKLQAFDMLSVRDKHTKEFLEYLNIDSCKVMKTCDPAIAYDEFPNIDLSRKLKQLGIDTKRPLLGVRIPKKKQNLIFDDCTRFRKEGYQIISFMHPCKFADINIGGKLSPFEWVSLFKYLDFCISNSYHSLIFSIKNNVPIKVIDFDMAYGSIESKTHDLLNDLNMLYCYEDIATIRKKYKVDQNKLNDLKATYELAINQIRGLYHGHGNS